MFKPLRNLSARTTLASLAYLLITFVLLTGALHYFLDRLGREQTDELGNALSAQLSETLKQPLIAGDLISTQVLLDNLLADTPVIARATVYSSSNKIIAQSQRSATAGPLAPYISPVSVDDNMLAQLRLEMDEAKLMAEYRLPMWAAVGVWLLLSATLAVYLIRLARGYTRRIEAINTCFNSTADESLSELARLEVAVEPFMDHRREEDRGETISRNFALLAIAIPNLPKWQAQLNNEHFTSMLRKIDRLLDNHLALFNGRRLHTRGTAMLLEFDDLTGEDPLIRAINCANAFMQLFRELAADNNMPFELRITAGFRRVAHTGSPWFNDLAREQCEDRLLDILPLAGAWELIVDKEDISAEQQLGDCELEDLSAASVWQFRSYAGAKRDTFHRQTEFLAGVHSQTFS